MITVRIGHDKPVPLLDKQIRDSGALLVNGPSGIIYLAMEYDKGFIRIVQLSGQLVGQITSIPNINCNTYYTIFNGDINLSNAADD